MDLFENRRSFVYILESSELSDHLCCCPSVQTHRGSFVFFCCLSVNMHTKMHHELVSLAAVEFYMSIVVPCAYITCLKTDLEMDKYKNH